MRRLAEQLLLDRIFETQKDKERQNNNGNGDSHAQNAYSHDNAGERLAFRVSYSVSYKVGYFHRRFLLSQN